MSMRFNRQQYRVSIREERGVALVVALIFLLVVTVISVVAANNSRQGLSMTTNLQDSYDSFQSAEAGVLAAIGTHKVTALDVFGDESEKNVFGALNNSTSPIGHLNGGNSHTEVDVHVTDLDLDCPRGELGSSVFEFDCTHYRIVAEHEVDRKAKSKVSQGVVKTRIRL